MDFWVQPDADFPGAFSVCVMLNNKPFMLGGHLMREEADKWKAALDVWNTARQLEKEP